MERDAILINKFAHFEKNDEMCRLNFLKKMIKRYFGFEKEVLYYHQLVMTSLL